MQGEMIGMKIQQKLGLTDEKHFRQHYKQPAVAKKLIEMTIPDKPQSIKRKYCLTDNFYG
jgi:ATP-dependent DNA helicase RecG